MRIRRVAVILAVSWICFFFIHGFPANAQADLLKVTESEPQAGTETRSMIHKKVAVISIPGLSFIELQGEQTDKAVWDMMNIMPFLEKLKHRSAWGAMNVRTPVKGMDSVYITLGAGQFAEAGTGTQSWQDREVVNGETAADRYHRLTGHKDNPAVAVADIEILRRVNESGSYAATPGRLGELLQKAGVPCSVWGNTDRSKIERNTSGKEQDWVKKARRYAPFMMMDTRGAIPIGDVSGRGLLIKKSMPFGIGTDYEWLLQKWNEQGRNALVLMELGDLQRLYEEQASYSDSTFRELKLRILKQIDEFIGTVSMTIDSDSAEASELWVISPQVNPDAAKQKSLLTPMLHYKPFGEEGLLISGSTRRSGIVSMLDIAPTLLQAYGLPAAEEMSGSPIRTMSRSDALSQLLRDVRRMQHVYTLRPFLLYGLAVYEVGVMLLVLAVGFLGFSSRLASWERDRLAGRTLLFSLLLAPGGLLLMGWLPAEPEAGAVIVMLGCVFGGSLGLAYVIRGHQKRIAVGLAASGGIVTALILYDGMHGAKAMQGSVLGYDAMIGARYYGIGNEFMGVLLGAALLGLTAVQQALHSSRRPRRAGNGPAGPLPAPAAAQLPPATTRTAFAAAVLPVTAGSLAAWLRPAQRGLLAPLLGAALPRAAASTAATAQAALLRPAARAAAALPAAAAGVLVVGYLASPALGTNAGGALAAAAGFGALAARQAGLRRWYRLAPVIALLLGAALAALWLLNARAATGLAADGQSHIGRAFDALLQGRFDVIGALIKRKLEMNGHLIAVSAWSKVLLTGLLVMAVLVLRPRGLVRRWQRRYPYLMYGCAANVIGAIAALLFNDSGIVAAATMIVYGSVPLLLLKLEDA